LERDEAVIEHAAAGTRPIPNDLWAAEEKDPIAFELQWREKFHTSFVPE
jgi:hypothetical protein